MRSSGAKKFAGQSWVGRTLAPWLATRSDDAPQGALHPPPSPRPSSLLPKGLWVALAMIFSGHTPPLFSLLSLPKWSFPGKLRMRRGHGCNRRIFWYLGEAEGAACCSFAYDPSYLSFPAGRERGRGGNPRARTPPTRRR